MKEKKDKEQRQTQEWGTPSLAVHLQSPVLCLAVDEERNVVFCGCADGSVAALAADSGNLVAEWMPFEKRNRVRSVTVAHGTLVVGADDGRLKRRYLMQPAEPGSVPIIASQRPGSRPTGRTGPAAPAPAAKPTAGSETLSPAQILSGRPGPPPPLQQSLELVSSLAATTVQAIQQRSPGVLRGGKHGGTSAAASTSPAAATDAAKAPASMVAAASTAEPVPQVFDDVKGEEELFPSHSGMVVALTEQEHGLLLSGAQDGTVRIWDMAKAADGGPKCLYGFGGYKVWLGSVATDSKRLVADGSDNAVLVHDFTRSAGAQRPE